MRDHYGKLMYMLQDAQSKSIADRFGFSMVVPIQLVSGFLKDRGASALLEDDLILAATANVDNAGGAKGRAAVDAEIAAKRAAQGELRARYGSGGGGGTRMTGDDVQRVLDSCADAMNYLSSNAGPVEKMIAQLETHFDAAKAEKNFSLSLSQGGGD